MRKNSVSRRKFLKVTGAAGISSALAGCSGDGGGGSDGPIKIGMISPQSFDIGQGGLRGAEIAAEEIQNNGGIMDREVELIDADTQGDPSQGTTVVNELINQDDVDLLVGTFISEVTLAIMDQVAETGVPFIVTGAASPNISQNYMGEDYERYKNTFRIHVNADIQADRLGDYAVFLNDEHGWESFALTPEDAVWTQPFSERTGQRIEENGLEVAMDTRFAPDTSDFTPILNNVEDSGADVMLKVLGHVSGTSLLSTWRENEYPFAQEGVNTAGSSPQYWEDTNGASQYDSTGTPPQGVAEITEKTKPMVDKFIDTYSSRPTLPMYMGMFSYDALYVYKQAVEAAGTTDYTNELDSIVAELSGTDYTGASGRIQFYDEGSEYPNDLKEGVDLVPFLQSQWTRAEEGQGHGGTNGELVPTWPEAYAVGDHQAPPWVPTE